MRTESTGASGHRISARSLLLVGSAVAAGFGISKLLRHARAQTDQALEKRQDKTVKDSYPASDPPASQYYDIPVNRR